MASLLLGILPNLIATCVGFVLPLSVVYFGMILPYGGSPGKTVWHLALWTGGGVLLGCVAIVAAAVVAGTVWPRD